MWAQSPPAAAPSAQTRPQRARTTRPGSRPPRRLWLTLLKWGAIAGLLGALLMVGTVAFVFWMYGRDPKLPDYQRLSDYKPRQVTLILDASGRRIGELYGKTGPTIERRTFLPFDKIPPQVADAFVAAEDQSFWTHGGVDYWGMFRAFVSNVRALKTTQGASTITQQVIKNLLLTPERTFKRKIQEIILARRLESALTKQEILTLYMNEIYFGHDRYGVQEAARYYFGKDVAQLNPGEAAVLGGLPKEPETIANALQALRGVKKGAPIPADLLKKAGRAKERQTYVLNRMVEMGKLAPAEAQKWIDQPIQVVEQPFPELGSAPEWVSLVRGELIAGKCKGQPTCPEGEDYLDRLGATIRITIDPELQATAHQALQRGLREVDKRRRAGRPVRTIKPARIDDEIARLARALPRGGPARGEVHDAVVTAVHAEDRELVVDLGNWTAGLVLGGEAEARFNPPDADGNVKSPDERFKRGDVVRVIGLPDAKPGKDGKPAAGAPKHADHRVAFAPGVEGAVVVLDLKTRKLRALVGGYTSKVAGFNRATMAKRQPGSSFKPFVYAAAYRAGKDGHKIFDSQIPGYTPASEVIDGPEKIAEYLPKNYDASKTEGRVLLRYALARSINTVAVKVARDIHPEVVARLANEMGIKSKLPETPSIALGSGEVTPLEMTNAIATLGAGGFAAEPRAIEAFDGKPTPPSPQTAVLDPAIAYVTLDTMRSVVTSGTGSKAAKLGVPIAGKTGTSNDARDVWFIGMTPDLAMGVWIGYDDNRSMGSETGGEAAVPVWVEIAKSMNLPGKAFPRPPGVVEAKIDRKTGKLAPEGFPKAAMITEVFVEGTVPTEFAPMPDEVTDANQTEREYNEPNEPATD